MPPKAAEPSTKKFFPKWGWCGLNFSNKFSDNRTNPFGDGFTIAELVANMKKEGFQ